jgi:Mannose-6-phosphate isomerase
MDQTSERTARVTVSTLLLLLAIVLDVQAQERTVDPTWLHRFVPRLSEAKADPASPNCHYTPIFGDGDSQNKILRSVTRFGEATLDANESCRDVLYEREEEIYFILQGTGTLHYRDETHPLRANDFVYLAPGVKHSIANNSTGRLRVLVMGFKVPPRITLGDSPQHPKIVNMDNVKEQPVDGHPTSVLYKLLVGSRGATRDAVDDAYVVTSLFLMDFGPGGTNFPHHHETAEEIYLVLDGRGDMVAGSGMDGIEARFPSQAGDAYYFRPNCTVGFYNQNKSGAKAYILAVRSRIPLPEEQD